MPEFPSLASLFAADGIGGYYVVQPAQKEDIGNFHRRKGGNLTPPWWYTDLTIFRRTLHIYRLKSAFLFPKLGVVVSSEGDVMRATFGEAQYRLGTLDNLPFATRSESSSTVCLRPPPDLLELGACIITLPWGGVHNYGHFLLDCLPAVALLRDVPEVANHSFVFPILKQWQHDHLVGIGLTAMLSTSSDICFCREVVWTSNMDHHLQGPNISLEKLSSIHIRHTARGRPRKIWLSRSSDKKRRFEDNLQLEARLAELGFEIIHPEGLSVQDQIAAFENAAIVCGFTGAAFANIIYCSRDSLIVEIQPTLMQGTWVRNIALSKHCEWVPYFCDALPASRPVIIGGEERTDIGIEIKLDVDDFINFLHRDLHIARPLT